jgi:hypothetical protein
MRALAAVPALACLLIFYNNAARFLRLSKEDIARHHSF